MREILSKEEKILILYELLAGKSVQYISNETNVAVRLINKYRKEWNAYSPLGIEEAIVKLKDDYMVDRQKQESCTHTRIYFFCHDCRLAISENDPEKMITAIRKHIEHHPHKVLIQVKL